MFPRPFVFERHELVHIHGFAIQQPFVIGVDALGKVVLFRTFSCGVAAGHNFFFLVLAHTEDTVDTEILFDLFFSVSFVPSV
jgi:hypothetical protein